MSNSPSQLAQDIEQQTLKKIFWRLIPFLIICYMMAYIDRGNVGMAALQMNEDLGLTPRIFGFGSSLFFVSYFICEIPSNLALQRFGARKWIARIMITWGLITLLTALVNSANTFYFVRFLLGAAEAGFFPGVVLYLSFWFPAQYRARTVALFMVAIPAASIVGSPISAGLLQMDGAMGMRGWHWLFILEGVPTMLLGFVCLKWLANKPSEAKWLTPSENEWLSSKFAAEQTAGKRVEPRSFWRTLCNKYVLCLALVDACASGASSTMAVWQPQLLKSFGLTVTQTGILNSVPYAVSAVAMIYWGRHSDRKGERLWHTIIAILFIAGGCIAASLSNSLALTVAALSCVIVGAYSLKGPFWALASAVLSNRAAAVGLATINAVSTLIGGGLMVNVFGWVKQSTGSYALAMLPLAGLTVISIIALLYVTRKSDLKHGNLSAETAKA
jgi:MFS transporter, ACS family, tartrate transporter